MNKYAVYTEWDLLVTKPNQPPQPLIIVEAFSITGAKAALYVACKDGSLDDSNIDIEKAIFLNLSDVKSLKADEENYEFNRHQTPNWG